MNVQKVIDTTINILIFLTIGAFIMHLFDNTHPIIKQMPVTEEMRNKIQKDAIDQIGTFITSQAAVHIHTRGGTYTYVFQDLQKDIDPNTKLKDLSKTKDTTKPVEIKTIKKDKK